MFVDYYAILEIDETASLEDIKSAFRKQAIMWHPDRNLGRDTTIQMQLINEAYLILKDTEARSRFDFEYQKFKPYKKAKEQQKTAKTQKEKEEEKERVSCSFKSEVRRDFFRFFFLGAFSFSFCTVVNPA